MLLYRYSPQGVARFAIENDSTVAHKYSRQKKRLSLTSMQSLVPNVFTLLLGDPQLVCAHAYVLGSGSSQAVRMLSYAVDRDYQHSSVAAFLLPHVREFSLGSDKVPAGLHLVRSRGLFERAAGEQKTTKKTSSDTEEGLIKGNVCKPEGSYVNGSVIKAV